MTTNESLQSLQQEVAALRAELAELRTRSAPRTTDPHFGRRHLIGALAGLGAAGAAGIATAQTAVAAAGDPLILGANNASATTTRLQASGNSEALVLSATNTESPTVVVESVDGMGVVGFTQNGIMVGVVGNNHGGGPGVGAVSDGVGPQLVLAVSEGDAPGPPSVGTRWIGEIKADVNGDLWMCVATGTPGTWTRLLREDTAHGRTVPVTPVRVLDTRDADGRPGGSPIVPGQVGGKRHGGQTVTLDLSGHAGIPATATGVLGRLTVVDANGTGYLRLAPAGTATIASALNFIANVTQGDAFTCRLAPAGIRITAPISNTITFHLVVDVTGYIT